MYTSSLYSGVTRAPPPPTPGRDIAGEESGAGSGGSHAYPGPARREPASRRESRDHYEARDPYDSTDDRDNRDSDSGGDTRGYPGGRRHRHGSPGARSGHYRQAARLADRSYRSSTDREDERRYPGRRDEERRPSRRQGERDHRSYYDRRRDEDRRRREEEEDDRRSHRGGDRSRHIKREPRDWDEDTADRYSVYDDEDRRSHRGGHSRPASRQGSISHYDQDSSFGYRNMSNMSMSSQWAMMQQHQAMIQQAMQQQMMALNPLQFQVICVITNS